MLIFDEKMLFAVKIKFVFKFKFLRNKCQSLKSK